VANSKGGDQLPPKRGSQRAQSPAGPKGKAQQRPAAKPIARSSVAQARKASTNNRTQLIIGGVAILLIIAVIVFGLILNKRETAVQSEGYGPSTKSVATVQDGVVTVSAPAAGSTAVTIDLYEDPLCPACAQFEQQFGQQINQAVDDGKLIVNVRMLNFLNPRSASGDYSTRATAATVCVAQNSGTQPGVYLTYKDKLYEQGTQPAEGGSTDLSNQQLAELATAAGASSAAADCISSGSGVQAAAASAQAAEQTLAAATGGQVATPSVIKDGAPIKLPVDWLTQLVGTL
jgi:protein-disulfide isomerase